MVITLNLTFLNMAPLFPALLGAVAGVLCGYLLPEAPLACCFIPAVLSIPCLFLRKYLTGIILLTLSIAWASAELSRVPDCRNVPNGTATYSGTVIKAGYSNSSQCITINMAAPDSTDVVGDINVMAYYKSDLPTLFPGDIVRFSGQFKLPQREVDFPLENDMTDYYTNQGISLICFIPDDSLKIIGRSSNILLACRRLGCEVTNCIIGSDLRPEAAAFFAAVLAGDASLLDDAARDDFARAGVAHVIALSGAHVAVLSVIISLLLWPLVPAGYRRLRWVITIVLLWAFAAMTGLSPSVVRAVLMASAILLALLLDRPRSSFNALCFAGIVILIFTPLALFNISFQLSFIATLFIVLLAPKLSPTAGKKWHIHWLLSTLWVTFVATLGTFGLTTYYFHRLPVFFLLANIVAAAMLPWLLGGGVAMVLCFMADINPGWLIDVNNWLYSIFDYVVTTVASWPGAVVDGIYFDWWLLVPLYICLCLVILWLLIRNKWLGRTSLLFLVFTIFAFVLNQSAYPNGDAYLVRDSEYTMITIHRNDSLFVLAHLQSADTKGEQSVISQRAAEFIKSRKINHLIVKDYVALTDSGNLPISFGNHKMQIAVKPSTVTPNLDADYCFVPREWYGSPVSLAKACGSDTIVLARDMNSIRRKRYARELQRYSIPVIDLGQRGLSSK